MHRQRFPRCITKRVLRPRNGQPVPPGVHRRSTELFLPHTLRNLRRAEYLHQRSLHTTTTTTPEHVSGSEFQPAVRPNHGCWIQPEHGLLRSNETRLPGR